MEGINMNNEKELNPTSFVRAAKEGNWDFVDKNLEKICDKGNFVAWAVNEGLYSENENVRDLGASILEKSTYELDSETNERANKRLIKLLPEENYVGFRAACALVNNSTFDRPDDQIKGKVKGQLEQIANNPEEGEDTKNIANKYLQKISL